MRAYTSLESRGVPTLRETEDGESSASLVEECSSIARVGEVVTVQVTHVAEMVTTGGFGSDQCQWGYPGATEDRVEADLQARPSGPGALPGEASTLGWHAPCSSSHTMSKTTRRACPWLRASSIRPSGSCSAPSSRLRP